MIHYFALLKYYFFIYFFNNVFVGYMAIYKQNDATISLLEKTDLASFSVLGPHPNLRCPLPFASKASVLGPQSNLLCLVKWAIN